MYCSSCGKSLSRQMKFCNGCGAQLAASGEKPSKERLDEYLNGLFWITLLGLGLILGGLVLMTKVQLNNWLIASFLLVSSVAFFINFWLNLAETLRIIKGSRAEEGTFPSIRLDTNELGPEAPRVAIDSAAPSVTENTTRTLEPASRERIR